MQRTLSAQYTPSISCDILSHVPSNGVNIRPLHRRSCAQGLKFSKWGLNSKRSRRQPEIVCLFDGLGKIFGEDTKDAARKAIEKAQEEKDKAFRWWTELTTQTAQTAKTDRAKDNGGGDDGSGGGGYGGGGYGGWGGSSDPEDEDDKKETVVASTLFILLYMKMRGERWTRGLKSSPYSDYDVLRMWLGILLGRVAGYIEGTLFFFNLGFTHAKMYLRKLRKKRRRAKSSTSTISAQE